MSPSDQWIKLVNKMKPLVPIGFVLMMLTLGFSPLIYLYAVPPEPTPPEKQTPNKEIRFDKVANQNEDLRVDAILNYSSIDNQSQNIVENLTTSTETEIVYTNVSNAPEIGDYSYVAIEKPDGRLYVFQIFTDTHPAPLFDWGRIVIGLSTLITLFFSLAIMAETLDYLYGD